MSDFVIGLTGGIASGKSALGKHFEALGVTVVDADAVAREVVAPGPVLSRIAERFGTHVLQTDGTLDRRVLRELVFADEELRLALEAITHPAIRERLHAQCRAASGPYAIAAIPLLTEAGGRATYPWLDRILAHRCAGGAAARAADGARRDRCGPGRPHDRCTGQPRAAPGDRR